MTNKVKNKNNYEETLITPTRTRRGNLTRRVHKDQQQQPIRQTQYTRIVGEQRETSYILSASVRGDNPIRQTSITGIMLRSRILNTKETPKKIPKKH